MRIQTVSQGSTYRLPRTVTPSAYEIGLRVDPASSTCPGTVRIALTVNEPVSEITLNARDITVVGTPVVTAFADGTAHPATSVSVDPAAQRITVALGSLLAGGEYMLDLAFEALVNDHMHGLYRSHYRTADEQERTVIATHFEATDARRAFPCWDEPDLKATFAMTLVVPDGDIALTNTPELEREPADAGFSRIRFAPSMRMASYLVAIVVGALETTEPRFAGRTPIRSVCRPESLALADYATQVGVFSIDWFSTYYDTPYPEQKLDQVAIPDFAQGAMENTGLVTYRETLLLLDPTTATPDERLFVAETIAHENAHMWFGDLVTMRWWNGIWLNEAFATFMAYLCVDAMEPSWRVFDAVLNDRVRAFEVDSLATTRPIEFPVESPDEASGMFDVLTYTKGGAVLRMIEQWLGPDTFRDGIRRYLATHAYANTETHDLWDALAQASGHPIRRIMEPWIFQPGYPAISVVLDGDVIRLSQRRFAPSLPDDRTTWPVPLIVRQITPDGDVVQRVLVEDAGLEMPLAHPEAIVVANAGSTAFVRTFYDDDLRRRLTKDPMRDLSAAERQSLVDDAWATVVAGSAGVGSFLDLAAGFRDEASPAVWRTLIGALAWIDRFLDGAPRERFREDVRSLVGPALRRLGWEARDTDTRDDRELRGDLIRAMGILGDDRETQALAREDEASVRTGHEVDPAVASAAIDVVAFVGDARDYDTFLERMAEGATPQEQDRYRYALPTFRDPDLMDRTLELIASGEVRAQDGPYMLQVAEMNRDLGERAWTFVRENWDRIVPTFTDSNVIALAQGARWLTTEAQVADVQAFFAANDIPQNHLTLTQAMERQRLYATLRTRSRDELAARFGQAEPVTS
jgi:puromycin-sensitive aminopeptidase